MAINLHLHRCSRARKKALECDFSLLEFEVEASARVRLVVEVKSRKNLEPAIELTETADGWMSNGVLTSISKQVYTYMYVNRLHYALLTCFTHTWVVYLPALPESSNDRKVMYMSLPIAAEACYTDQAPQLTTMGVVAYLQEVAIGSLPDPLASRSPRC